MTWVPVVEGPELVVDEVERALNEAFRDVAPYAGEEFSMGVFVMYDCARNREVLCRRLGQYESEMPARYDRCERNAKRKVGAVAYEFDVPRLASSFRYRSPNPELTEAPIWGGGVRCGRYIAAFSGFPEHVDELLVCVVLFRLHIMDEDEIRSIFALSKNPTGAKVFQRFFGMVC